MTTFTGTLHPHQQVGLEFLRAQRRAILADEVGLGKTVQVAALIGSLADEGALRKPAPDPKTLPPGAPPLLPLPVLWITTAGLAAQTKDELERFLPTLGVTTSESGTVGNRADRKRMAEFLVAHPDGPDVIIINNDLATRRADHLASLRPSLVVVDEASALKGAGARYEAVKGLCDAADRVVVMTATPYENDPLELWAVMSLAGLPGLFDREAFGDRYVSWWEFANGDKKPTGWLSPGHAGAVMRWLGPRFLRRTPSEVGLPLPVKVDSGHRLVALSQSQQREYDRASWIGHALIRHQRQAQAARRAKDGSSSIVDASAAEVVRLARTGSKVVVYAEHLETLDDLSDRLRDAGVAHVSIRGEDAKADRLEAVARFRDDPVTSVLLGTKVLEYGLNLQFANVLVSVGQTYNPARERQREGRLCRIGSPHTTYRHLVYLPDTAQTHKQIATLGTKAAHAAPVLNGGAA